MYVEVKEDERTPDLFPMLCLSTLCLFCLGDRLLPSKDRELHFPKRSNLRRHVQAQHVQRLEVGVKFPCSH